MSEMNENFQPISVAIKLHKLITLMELEIMLFFGFKRQNALKFGYLFQSTFYIPTLQIFVFVMKALSPS